MSKPLADGISSEPEHNESTPPCGPGGSHPRDNLEKPKKNFSEVIQLRDFVIPVNETGQIVPGGSNTACRIQLLKKNDHQISSFPHQIREQQSGDTIVTGGWFPAKALRKSLGDSPQNDLTENERIPVKRWKVSGQAVDYWKEVSTGKTSQRTPAPVTKELPAVHSNPVLGGAEFGTELSASMSPCASTAGGTEIAPHEPVDRQRESMWGVSTECPETSMAAARCNQKKKTHRGKRSLKYIKEHNVRYRQHSIQKKLDAVLLDCQDAYLPRSRTLDLLRSQKGCVVMLLRNLNVQEGECNGTRLRVVEIEEHLLTCEIITGGRFEKSTVLIPRIDMEPGDQTDPSHCFVRRQFPVRLAYAMTINKAQGQSLKKVGIILRTPVFAHGQLYVALSRATTQDGVKVFIQQSEDELQEDEDEERILNQLVYNKVFREILL